MQLTNKDVRFLRAMAHKLKPVVIVGGSGVSEGVVRELDSTLEHHELIKVKVNAGAREARQSMIDSLCAETGALHIQTIGHVATLYRPAKTAVIILPSAAAR